MGNAHVTCATRVDVISFAQGAEGNGLFYVCIDCDVVSNPEQACDLEP